MQNWEYKKIAWYLYNIDKLEEMIEERKMLLIESTPIKHERTSQGFISDSTFSKVALLLRDKQLNDLEHWLKIANEIRKHRVADVIFGNNKETAMEMLKLSRAKYYRLKRKYIYKAWEMHKKRAER